MSRRFHRVNDDGDDTADLFQCFDDYAERIAFSSAAFSTNEACAGSVDGNRNILAFAFIASDFDGLPFYRIFGKRILPCPGKGLRAFWTWISNFPKHLRCPRAKSYPPSLMSNSPDPEIHWGISHSLLLTDSGCRKPQPIGGQIQS